MLEFHSVSRRFGPTVALEELSFTVPEASIWGFVGRNGAGKTTAMRIALGLLAPDTGHVHWRGASIGAETRGRIGYMPEERGLYPKMRIGDQLSYLARLHGYDEAAADEATAAWLERLGLTERASDRVEALSLGNQQRVQLGAALVHSPELLILDEPFSGLDPVAVDVLSTILRERVRDGGTTVLFSSHQLELVERLCDGVTIIDSGQLVAAGTVTDLRRGDGARRFHLTVDADLNWAVRPGIRVVHSEGDDVVIEVANGTDPQELLRAAMAAGTVSRFGPHEASIAELFAQRVTGEHAP